MFRCLFPELAQRLLVVGRNIGVSGYSNIIEELIETTPSLYDGIHSEINNEADSLRGDNEYGIVPIISRNKKLENEQGL